jgi:hypothetical protein
MNQNPHSHTAHLAFDSKESYLAYRRAWNAEYKKLSGDLRILRLAERFHQRSQFAKLPLSTAEQRCLDDATRLCEAGQFGSSLAAFLRRRRSVRATQMLLELKQAKAEAQRQFLARKLPGGQ